VGQPQQRGGLRLVTVELANLRTAFRWATTKEVTERSPPPSRHAAAWLAFGRTLRTRLAWAEELIEPAPHRRSSDNRFLMRLESSAGGQAAIEGSRGAYGDAGPAG